MGLGAPYIIDLAGVCEPAATLEVDAGCAAARRLFANDSTLARIVVVDRRDRPLGVIPRPGPYDVGERAASLIEWMIGEPVVLERVSTVEELSTIASALPAATLQQGVVVMDGDRVAGVASALNLLRLVTDHLRCQSLELEAARQEADNAATSKDRFFANMTHELRTPLNGVIGFGQLLESEAHGPLGAPEYKLYAKDIVASGQHLISIISDILDLAKIEAGRVELQERFVNLRELTGRTLRMVGPIAARKRINLHSGTYRREWAVRADERRLQQAIINLLSNAIKFTPEGGDVGVEFGADAGWAWVEVWDRGCGVAEEDLARLFKPFEQIQNAGGGKHEGTGLGLTITRALMRAHGGDVEFQSVVGHGTRARLLLPRDRLVADKFAWSVQSRVEYIDPVDSGF